MSIIIVATQAGGKGDLIFGCKLARFLLAHSKEKIYLINAIPASEMTSLALSEFKSDEIAMLSPALQQVYPSQKHGGYAEFLTRNENWKSEPLKYSHVQQLYLFINQLPLEEDEKLTLKNKIKEIDISDFDKSIPSYFLLQEKLSHLVVGSHFSNTQMNIEVIHFVFDGEGKQVNTISNLKHPNSIIQWEQVSSVFIAPGHSYNYEAGKMLSGMRFGFFNENPRLNRATPIYLFSEYSFNCQIHTGKVEFQQNGFTHVEVCLTGLGEEEIGIFWNSSSLSSSDIPQLVNGMTTELQKALYQPIEDDYNQWHQEKWRNTDHRLSGDIRDSLQDIDCFSIYYNSSYDPEHFQRFVSVQHAWMQYKQCKKPFVLVIMPKIIGNQEEIEALIASGYIFLKSLNFSAMQAFYRMARKAPGIGSCTGDQSLSDTLSANLIPVYHKIEATKEVLAQYLAKKCLKGLPKQSKKSLSTVLFDVDSMAPDKNTQHIFSDSLVIKIHENIASLRNEKDLTRNFEMTQILLAQHTNQGAI